MTPNWVSAGPLEDLAAKGRRLLRSEGKQVALFHTPKGVFAINNRCPHEGYPLMEGTLDQDCRLTCNWHAWRFDLTDGRTEEGDKVRSYPVELRGGEVFVDVSDPPAETRIAEALSSIEDALKRRDRGRMARELARLEKAGGDPNEAVSLAIEKTKEGFRYGMSHAQGAAADWLGMRLREAETPAQRLVPLVEVIDHIVDDSLGEPPRPYAEAREAYSQESLFGAILESDDECSARLLRDAFAQGLGWAEIEPVLARAAFHHYADFGHSVIYTYKTGELLEHLGPGMAETLALLLARALCEAWREDLIPEFRGYAPSLEAWDESAREPVSAEDFQGLTVKRALERALKSAGRREELHQALLGAAAWNMLHYKLEMERDITLKPADSKTWLSFTHAITFANAGRVLAERQPALWPQFLLQLACFVGRNSEAVRPGNLEQEWGVAEGDLFLKEAFKHYFDHGNAEPIVTAHLVKLTTAVKEETEAFPDAPWRGTLLAALHRFLKNPPHRPQVLRLATQAVEFVAQEG
ncbi:Rieske (2Fe-2S) protein [Limibacillus halophilus]